MKNEDATKELINIVNRLKEHSEKIFFDIINSSVEVNQGNINLLKTTEDTLSALDDIMDLVAKNPLDAEVFKDFTKHRDLTRDFIRVLKRKVLVDKEFVDVMNAIQWWATQK